MAFNYHPRTASMHENLQQGRVSMGYLYSLDNILYFKSPSWERNCKGLSKIVSSLGSAPDLTSKLFFR